MLVGLLVLGGSDMNINDILKKERENTGTAWTYNDEFERNGFLVLKKLCDPDKLHRKYTGDTGTYTWWGKGDKEYNFKEEDPQVKGSLSHYWHPQYRKIHTDIRFKLENIIGRKLYNTYYFDRTYYSGNELKKHVDRDACEISVSVHISSNVSEPWKFHIKTPDTYNNRKKGEILIKGEECQVDLAPGDGLLYKGCERPHWRESLPSNYKRLRSPDDTYYHQVFFHYVLQDGERAQCAWDRAR